MLKKKRKTKTDHKRVSFHYGCGPLVNQAPGYVHQFMPISTCASIPVQHKLDSVNYFKKIKQGYEVGRSGDRVRDRLLRN